MTHTEDKFDDLRAPEVVKPISPKLEQHRRGMDAVSTDSLTPRVRSAATEDKNDQRVAVPSVKPEQSKTLSSTPRTAPLLSQPAKLKTPISQYSQALNKPPPNPSYAKRGWIVVSIVAGIWLLIFYAASTRKSKETPRRTVPTTRSVEQTQAPITPDHPRGTSGLQTTPNNVSVQSLPAKVRFIFPTNDVTFSVYDGARLLGTEKDHFLLTPSVPYILTFKAQGWRDQQMSVTLPMSGVTYNCPVKMEQVVPKPLPAKVCFIFPTNDVTFSVYDGVRLLENSNNYYDLEPSISHKLTFKALGWRDKQQTVTLAEPGIKYRCPVEMEKIEARLQVTVECLRGKKPVSGFISFDGNAPIKADFPITAKVRRVGLMTLALSVKGYHVLNNTQRVNFIDRQMTNVVFTIEPDNK